MKTCICNNTGVVDEQLCPICDGANGMTIRLDLLTPGVSGGIPYDYHPALRAYYDREHASRLQYEAEQREQYLRHLAVNALGTDYATALAVLRELDEKGLLNNNEEDW